MNCREFKQLIPEVWTDEIRGKKRDAFFEHIDNCKECSAEFERLNEKWEALYVPSKAFPDFDDAALKNWYRAYTGNQPSVFKMRKIAAIFIVALLSTSLLAFFFVSRHNNPGGNTPASLTHLSPETQLHAYVGGDKIELVKQLIAEGIDVDCRNKEGRTPLHVAASTGNKRIAEILVDEGADVNALDNYGATPLHMAVLEGRPRVAELLLDYGADPNIVNGDGWTPINIAFIKNDGAMRNLLAGYGAGDEKDSFDEWDYDTDWRYSEGGTRFADGRLSYRYGEPFEY